MANKYGNHAFTWPQRNVAGPNPTQQLAVDAAARRTNSDYAIPTPELPYNMQIQSSHPFHGPPAQVNNSGPRPLGGGGGGGHGGQMQLSAYNEGFSANPIQIAACYPPGSNDQKLNVQNWANTESQSPGPIKQVFFNSGHNVPSFNNQPANRFVSDTSSDLTRFNYQRSNDTWFQQASTPNNPSTPNLSERANSTNPNNTAVRNNASSQNMAYPNQGNPGMPPSQYQPHGLPTQVHTAGLNNPNGMVRGRPAEEEAPDQRSAKYIKTEGADVRPVEQPTQENIEPGSEPWTTIKRESSFDDQDLPLSPHPQSATRTPSDAGRKQFKEEMGREKKRCKALTKAFNFFKGTEAMTMTGFINAVDRIRSDDFGTDRESMLLMSEIFEKVHGVGLQ